MSNLFPMVSSSPPPFEDEGGDDWDEDFGNFMGADNFVTGNEKVNSWTEHSCSNSPEIPKFADFSGFKTTSETNSFTPISNDHNETSSKGFALNLDKENVIPNSDSGLDMTRTEAGSDINNDLDLPDLDSGMCSSEASPNADDGKNCTTVNGLSFQENKSLQDQPLHLSSQTSQETLHTCSHVEEETEEDRLAKSCNSISENYETSSKQAFENHSIQNMDLTDTDKHTVVTGESLDLSENLNSSVVSCDVCVENTHKGDLEDTQEKIKMNNNSQNCSDVEVLSNSSYKQTEQSSGNCEDFVAIPSSDENLEHRTHDLSISESKSSTETSSSLYSNEKSDNSSVNEESVDTVTSCDNKILACRDLGNDEDDFCEFEGTEINFRTDCEKFQDENEHLSDEKFDIDQSEEVRPTTQSNNGYAFESSEEVQKVSPMESTDTCQFEEVIDVKQHTDKTWEENNGSDSYISEQNLKFNTSATTDTELQSQEVEQLQRKDDEQDFEQFQGKEGEDDFGQFSDYDVSEDDFVTDQDLHLKLDATERDVSDNENNSATSDAKLQGKTDDEDDFGQLQSIDDNGEDDFDDFAAFDSAPLTFDSSDTNTIAQTDEFGAFSEISVPTNEEEDNFAAFSNANDGGFATFSDASVTDDGEGWASFKETEPKTTNDDIADDDFEDFTSTDVVPQAHQKVSQGTRADDVVGGSFPENISDKEFVCNTDVLDALLSSATSNTPSNSPDVWTKLKKQASGSLKWADSKSNKQLFSSLKIDTRNILLGHKKPSVPIYAANLTLLEPTKGPAKPSQPDMVTLVDTTKTEVQQTQDLPPVQFDWTGSGLVNPLKSSNKSLDLDFLVVQETEAGGRSGVFDSELMHGQKPSNIQPLENILATLKSSSTVKKTKNNEKFGEEAGRIIKSLPDLSFMHAKVLMFPIRHQTDS